MHVVNGQMIVMEVRDQGEHECREDQCEMWC